MGLVVPMVFNHFQSNSISIWHSSGELRQICKGKSGRKDFKMVHPFPWGATESRCSSHAHIVQNPWDIRCRVWYLEEYIWWWIRGSGYQIWDPPYFDHQLLDIRLEILYVHPRRPPPSPMTLSLTAKKIQFFIWIENSQYSQGSIVSIARRLSWAYELAVLISFWKNQTNQRSNFNPFCPGLLEPIQ